MVRKTTPIYQNWRRMLYCTASAVLFCAPSAHANPEDGVVADGQAQIITSINAVDIHQQTDRVVIDWRSFDIAAGERTEFHQPSASAIALNRVHSSQASIINGALTANGNVVIINQNGVTFGKNAQVDVNGLVATSTDIENQRFMNDRTPHFNKPGAPTSIIINEGRITAKESGLVGFVAPHVENSGVIQARMGRVTLASGDTSTVDFYGDGLLEVAVSDAAQKQLVRNTGTLSADGGTITMTAAAGSKLLASAIEVEGTLRAQTVQQKNGTIVISGMGQHAVTGNVASNKGKSPTLSNITLQANLDVSGKTISEQGGKIVVTADNITLKNGTNINANGASGGGIVRVGGEYLGQGTTPVARNLTMESGSVIQASATTQGHGGEVILFSENTTRFDGIIRANAAGTGGNGGFVETSGKAFLHIDSGTVQAKATGGNAGNWLLDPADITITAATNSNITGATPFTATATGSQVSAATIVGVLNGNTNVTVQTTNDAFAGNGDIFVNSAINTTGTGALTLSAFRNIDVGAAITLNGGALTLRSNNTGGAGGGSIRTTAAITTNGGNVTMSGGAAAPTSATYNANGSVNVAATGYAQGINLANFYNGVSIGANINATGTAAGGNILINGRGENGTNASHGVEVTSGALSTNFAGTINISGIGQGTAGNGNQVHGVALRNNATTVNGNIQINGISGGGSGANNVGVLLSSIAPGGIARTTGNGAIILSGTAGASTAAAYGVLSNFANGINTTGATAASTITVYGSGGTGTSGQKIGIGIAQANAGTLVSNRANITMTGLGGTATTANNNYGIVLTGGGGGGIVSNTNAGNITLTGTGGGAAGSTNNHGVYITGTGASITSNGSGTISVTGTGGAGTGGTNHGVYSNIANGISNSGTGSITITGTAGTTSGSGFITDVANGVRTSGTAGNITIASDTYSLNAANNINSVGTITIGPRTPITMGVGTGASTLQLNDTTLGYLTAATGFVFGNTTALDLTVNTALPFTSRALSFTSNANITVTNSFDNLSSFTTTAANGTTTINGVIGGTTAVGAVNMTGRDLAINANITSSNNINAALTRDITVANTGRTITTGAGNFSLTMTAAGNNVLGTGNLTLNDAILRVGTGALNLTSGVNGTRPSWTATTTNLVRQGATFGAVTIQGFLDTFLNRDINSAGNLTVLGFRDVTLNAANTFTGGGANSVSLRAANGNAANTGTLYLNGNVSVGLGGLTLLSGQTGGVRPTYTATAVNLVRSNATFGPVDIQGFNDFTLNRILNSTGTVSFSNNTRTILNNNVTSTAGTITFSNPVAIAEAANVTVSATNQNITFGSTILDTAGGVTESLTVNPGTATATFNGTVDGVALALTAGTANLNAPMGQTTALGTTTISTTISTTNALTTPNIRASSLSIQTTGAGSPILMGGSLETTGLGNALSVVANGQLVKSGAGNIISNNGTITLTGGTFLHLPSSFNILSNGGTVNLNGPSGIVASSTVGVTTNNGNLNINAPLTIAGPFTATLGTGALTLGGTVNGITPLTGINILAVGGGGGGGGTDAGNNGGGGGSGGALDTTINVISGQVYTILVGGGGGGGVNSLSSAAGGAGGTNGGGNGGNAGSSGSSGAGGGGGGASSVYAASTAIAVAGGGAGGGGGNEGFAKTSPAVGGGVQTSNTGTSTGGTGQTYPTDGGGGGGGGGGFLGGAGQTNISVSTAAAFTNGGSTYANPGNVSSTITNGNSGATLAGGSTAGAAVSLVAARATFYNYTANGAGGTAVVGGNAGSNGIVVIRYTGTVGQAVIQGGTTTTSGGDTIVTYTGTTGTNSFQPIAGCSGSCNFTVTAGSVTYGGAIGATTALDNVSITTTAAQTAPAVTAGAVTLSVTGAGNALTIPNTVLANRNGGALSLTSTNGALALNGSTLNSTNGTVTLTGATGINVPNAFNVNSGTAAINFSTTNSNITFGNNLRLGGNATMAAGTGTVAFGGTVNSASTNALQALVVGGGGGGGGGTGGGGGGGGVISTAIAVISGTPYAATVGTGGTEGTGLGVAGTSGTNSVFNTTTAIGGGGGGANNNINALNGGSGGGGAWNSSAGSGTASQGFAGGGGATAGPPNYGAGGGGGATAVGGTGTTTTAGNGGAGLSSGITGPAVTYGGGGGGGIFSTSSNFGLGGAGGGGNGGATSLAATNGTNGLGGGGGGAGNNTGSGGTGGNGTVIVRYVGSASQATATNATSTTLGTDTVWTFNTGTGSLIMHSATTETDLTVTGGNITYGGALGNTGAFNNVSLTSTNSQSLPSISAKNIFVQTTAATADISLIPSSVLTATGAGNALTLASGRNFINNSGSGALVTTAGRWLVYSTNPANDTTGGLANNFRRFSCTYNAAGTCALNVPLNQTVTIPAGQSGFLYSYTPTIAITPSNLSSFVYGTATPNLTGYTYTTLTATDYLSALDFAADTITGSLNGTTNYAPGPINGNVGSYYINHVSGTLSSLLGYGFTYGNNATAITVTPRPLTVSLTGTVSKQYDANTAATLVSGNYSIANIYNNEALSITNTSGTYANKNVGAGKNVTVTGLTLAGATAANYSLTSPNVTGAVGTITPAPLTVSATGIDKVYDGNTTATVTLGDNRIGGDVLTLSYGTATFNTKNVGTTKPVSVTGINVTGTDSGNYTFNTTAATTADITPAALTVSATGINKVYNGNATAAVTLGDNRIGGDVLTLSFASALFPDKNVGNGRAVNVTGINVTGTDSGNYTFNTTAATTADITPASLTVSATGINKIYDANNIATVTLGDNRIGGDVLTITYASALFPDKNVGNGRAVNVTGINVTGTDSGNYSFNTTAATTADITQRALTVSASANSKVYDGNTTATVTLGDNRIGGDVLTLSYGTATFNTKNVGTTKPVSVTGINVTGTDSGNYSFNTTASNTADITKAPLTVTADDQSVTYGVTVPATTLSYSGFVPGEDPTFLATAPTASSTLSGIQNVGVYNGNYAVSGGVDSNYSFAYNAGRLTVTKKDLNVTADTITATYGTNVPAGTISYSGFIAGEDATFLATQPTISSGLSGVQNVGTYAANYTPSGGSSANYNFLYFNGNLVITKKDLTVTADNKTVNYGTAVPAGTFVYNGFITGQDATFLATQPTISSGLSGIQNAGSYVGNYTVSGGVDTNYNFIYVAGNLTVSPQGLNITVNNQTVIYGTAVPTTTITYTGFAPGEDATFLTTQPTIASAQTGIVGAGTYTGNYTASGAASPNYTFNYTAGNLTVSKKSLNVTAGNRTVTYGTAVPASSLAYTGFIAGEDATFLTTQPTITSALSGVVGAGSYVGNYVVSGGSSSNYNFNFTNGDLTVSKKTLNVTADTKTISYGTSVPTGTLSYAGFIAGEDASFLTTAPTVSSTLSGTQNVGTYVGNYTATGGVSANYNFVYGAGNLVVGKKALTINALSQTINFGTIVPATTISYSGFAAGEDASFLDTLPTVSSALSGIQNVGNYIGNYSASGAADTQYSFIYNAGNLTVNPVNVTNNPVVLITLPNTVIQVSQSSTASVVVVPDDGIFATPTTGYLLVYLPRSAAQPNVLRNQPITNTTNATPIQAAPSINSPDLSEPDEEKRLRQKVEEI